MPEITTIGAALLTMGLPGMVIFVLGFACWKLYIRLDKSHSERISDATTAQGRAIAALERNTVVLEKVVENLEQLTTAINKRREARTK